MNDEQNIPPLAKAVLGSEEPSPRVATSVEPGSRRGGQEGVEPDKCEKCDEYLAGWKRALADYDNLQKDLARERSDLRAHLKEDVAHQLISVLDNFDQAAKFKPEDLSKELEAWLMGLMHVKSQLEGVMRNLGLESYGSVGETFDAHLHDAGGERTEEDKADHEILEIVQRGWKLAEKVVRPAKVIINNIQKT